MMETAPPLLSLDDRNPYQDKENIQNDAAMTPPPSTAAVTGTVNKVSDDRAGANAVAAAADMNSAGDANDTEMATATAATTDQQEQHVFSPELLKMYYARLFPYSFLHTWLSYNPVRSSSSRNNKNDDDEQDQDNNDDDGVKHNITTNPSSSHVFGRREFSFTLEPIPGEEIYIRYQSFTTENDLRTAIMKRQPRKIDLGAVFSHPPKDKSAHPAGAFHPVQRELVFDIDLTDYDDVRNCGCSGAMICPTCWTFMQMACKVMDAGLRDDFGFHHIAWFYSGRRGIHAWVCDEEARFLTNEARSAVANYFEISLNKKKSEGLTYPLHPMLARAYRVLEPYFCQYVLPSEDGHGLLATPESWDDLLDKKLPKAARSTVGANLKKKWAQAPYETSPEEKWRELLRHLKIKFDLPSSVLGGGGSSDDDGDDDDFDDGNRGAANKRLKKNNAPLDEERQRIALWPVELVFQYTYPRLDINVSKMQNHLLKSPFCVHPKTGRVCVPIQPDKVDDFDPFTVPTLPQLARELDEAHRNVAVTPAVVGGAADDASNDDDGRRHPSQQQPQDWQKTSLKEYFEGFQTGFLEPLLKDLRRKQRDRAEMEAAVRGNF